MISRDDAHAGHDHDVDGRVRVEPEEVLEQHRVAAERGSKMPMWKTRSTMRRSSVIAEHRRRENLDERGRVDAPT